MLDTKPATAWASTSLVFSILAWLGGLPLPFIDYQNIAGATAGVGLIGPFMLGMLSALLGLVGLILGIVALARTRSGEFGGRGKAWVGFVLGGVLLTAYLVMTSRLMFGWW